MKPINEMTDQELAEAVAAEVLVWSWIDRPSSEFGGYWRKGGDGCRSYRRGAKQCIRSEIYHADGREAIEDELERRGWSFCSRYVAIANLHFFEIWIPERGSLEPDYMSLQKSFYLAIAKAALMAVRGEASHGKY